MDPSFKHRKTLLFPTQIPLVLVSGLLSNPSLWRHQIDHLSDIASIQVHSPSQDTSAKMVEAILNKAPPKFALVGHSMGGWLSLEIMRIAPSRVSHLCLLNTTSRMDSDAKKQRRQEMIHRAENGKFHEIAEELAENFVYHPLVKREVEKMFLNVGKETFVHQQKAMLARNESLSILSTITCPTLVIHAAKDKNFSLEEQNEMANQITDAKLAIVEDSGHMSPIEMPQAITALLKFWLTYF